MVPMRAKNRVGAFQNLVAADVSPLILNWKSLSRLTSAATSPLRFMVPMHAPKLMAAFQESRFIRHFSLGFDLIPRYSFRPNQGVAVLEWQAVHLLACGARDSGLDRQDFEVGVAEVNESQRTP